MKAGGALSARKHATWCAKQRREGVKVVGCVAQVTNWLRASGKSTMKPRFDRNELFPTMASHLKQLTGNMYAAKKSTFIAALLDDELVGFIQILYGDNIAILSNILSMQKHWDKSVNNAMLAKAVEVCASKRQPMAHVRKNRQPSFTG